MGGYRGRVFVVAAGLVAAAGSGGAAEDVYVNGNLHIDAGVEFGIYGNASPNPNFGFGRVDLVTGGNTGDAQWGEGYFRPSLGFRYDAQADTQIYGLVTGVLAGTVGDGD